MGGLDWWMDNLAAKETILRRHYSPSGFLYQCHTSTKPLMEELQSLLRPLAALPFDHSSPLPTLSGVAANKTEPSTSPKRAVKPSTPTKTSILKPATPVSTRSKTQRPLSYVQNSPTKTAASARPQYRRTQSQHSGLSPSKKVTNNQQQQQLEEENKVEEFTSLKQKWESLCSDRKQQQQQQQQQTGEMTKEVTSPLKSKIPRPVFRFNK